MVEASISQAIDSNQPGVHAVRLEVDDAETYTLCPFDPQVVVVTPHINIGAGDGIGIAISGRQITFHLVGTTTDLTVSLVAYK